MTYPALTALRAIFRPSDESFAANLTAAQRAILAVLVMHAGDDGTCFPSIPTICRASGLSRRMTIRTLSELEAKAMISRESRPPRPTLYTVHPMHGAGGARCTDGTVTVHDVHANSAPHAPERLKNGSLNDSLSCDESPKTDRRDFPPLAKLPHNGRGRVYPPEFEGAFGALPARHVPHPKAAAYSAWRARVREVEELFQLEAAADAYREDCERQGKAGTEFVMQAATFFGPGERWRPYLGRKPVVVSAPGAGAFVDRRSLRGAA